MFLFLFSTTDYLIKADNAPGHRDAQVNNPCAIVMSTKYFSSLCNFSASNSNNYFLKFCIVLYFSFIGSGVYENPNKKFKNKLCDFGIKIKIFNLNASILNTYSKVTLIYKYYIIQYIIGNIIEIQFYVFLSMYAKYYKFFMVSLICLRKHQFEY